MAPAKKQSKKQALPKRQPPARGSLRVQAWLYSALWPLGEAARHEQALLTAGDLTWRHGPERLDGIREAREHLTPAGRVNLADLLAEGDAALAPILERQARAVRSLTAAAAQTQIALVAGPVRDAVSRHGGHGRRDDALALADLAQDLINGALDRDVSGPEAAMWTAIRGGLAAVRGGVMFAALDAGRVELLAATDAMQREIATVRSRLCDQFDLPPAPVVSSPGHGR